MKLLFGLTMLVSGALGIVREAPKALPAEQPAIVIETPKMDKPTSTDFAAKLLEQLAMAPSAAQAVQKATCICGTACQAANCATCTNPNCRAPAQVCKDGSCSVQPRSHALQAGQPLRNAWRWVFHGQRWWFYDDQCNWHYHDGIRWHRWVQSGYTCDNGKCVPVDNSTRTPSSTLSKQADVTGSGCSSCGSGRVGIFGRRR